MIYQQIFIQTIAPYIVQEALTRGYKFPSAIIAQACLESAYGRSLLASEYCNYFGMKCGSSWTGRSVNLQTKEEYTAGTLTTIRDNFRVYDSMEEGIKGYFDFISTKRYKNLLTAVSSYDYLALIKSDGYATSNSYIENCYRVVETYGLLVWDNTTTLSASEELMDAVTTIAEYVIKGYFGNGHTNRKDAIYKIVRERVNELCKIS